ncbi:MAG: TlpA family protein disulfide reductase [Thermoguttaceae bacterium]
MKSIKTKIFVSVFALLVFTAFGMPTFAAEEAEKPGEGPNVTEPGKAPKVVPGEKPRKVDASTLQNIDLEKTPWLCESVGLTPSHAAFSRPRMIWANSLRFVPINEAVEGDVIVERWVNEPPKDLAGKYVMIEVWATWCPPMPTWTSTFELLPREIQRRFGCDRHLRNRRNRAERDERAVKARRD